MNQFNILTRRSFLSTSFKAGLGVALATLTDIPFLMKRALAEGTIGLNGTDGRKKKLLFIFLRGANDGLNTLIPAVDPAYNTTNRPNIMIPLDPGIDYSAATGACDFPVSGSAATFTYANPLRLGNGFAALHPSLKFLAPVYNAGQLALIHRVGYPKQSRSHFDSQNYWETGNPNNNLVKDGIFYRAMIESGLANSAPLTGVSIQSALPMILRGSEAAMTNLTDATRYNLLGIPNTTAGNLKSDNAITASSSFPYAARKNRQFLDLQYKNLNSTLNLFASINFTEAGNTFIDDSATDGDFPYYLFPTTNAKNGGGSTSKYVVDTGAYNSSGTGFFNNLKAAALILNKTDALITGTEMGGFDTHNNQVTSGSPHLGSHANLMRRIGWAMYALRKYFTSYGDRATWDNLVVITLSEFGRTTVQNTSLGTDHAEAGVMLVGGGGVRGGVYGCSPADSVPWVPGQTGTMFGVSNRYLKRGVDYRSVLGEIVRDHLGATQGQLNRIIPGYTNPGESLSAKGTSSIDGTPIMGELNLV
jgi:uncharacterized protein (DUF1501 family)